MHTRFTSVIRAAVVAALRVAVVPNVAQAALGPISGWVTARKPTTASYTPAASDQGNSSGGTNTVKRDFLGRYEVTFGGLDATAFCSSNGCLGTAIATAMSAKQRWCVAGDIQSALPVTVFVVCRDRHGNYADSAFSLNFLAERGTHHTLVYLWADQQSSSSYRPNAMHDFNSEDPSSEFVDRMGVGYYSVALNKTSAGTRGNLQVNGNLGTCKIEKRENNDDPGDVYASVNVRCRDLAGNPADNTFFMTYTDGLGLMGDSVSYYAAYVFAGRLHKSSYHPAAAFSYSYGNQAATVTRLKTGTYQVKLPGMSAGGSAQVSAFGTDRAACQLSSIATTTPQRVGVICFKPNGARIDSQFYLTFTH